jgi:hypothetical protein
MKNNKTNSSAHFSYNKNFQSTIKLLLKKSPCFFRQNKIILPEIELEADNVTTTIITT